MIGRRAETRGTSESDFVLVFQNRGQAQSLAEQSRAEARWDDEWSACWGGWSGGGVGGGVVVCGGVWKGCLSTSLIECKVKRRGAQLGCGFGVCLCLLCAGKGVCASVALTAPTLGASRALTSAIEKHSRAGKGIGK